MSDKSAGVEKLHIAPQSFDAALMVVKFEFVCIPEDPGYPFRIRFRGNVPYGNLELMFDRDGKCAGQKVILPDPKPKGPASHLHVVK